MKQDEDKELWQFVSCVITLIMSGTFALCVCCGLARFEWFMNLTIGVLKWGFVIITILAVFGYSSDGKDY